MTDGLDETDRVGHVERLREMGVARSNGLRRDGMGVVASHEDRPAGEERVRIERFQERQPVAGHAGVHHYDVETLLPGDLERLVSIRRLRHLVTVAAEEERERQPESGLVIGHQHLERAVGALPEGARAVFLLHDVQGYKHHEIADMMGLAVGTTKAQLHRARRLLREMLER